MSINKGLKINNEPFYCRNIPEFFDELFYKGVIDSFDRDTLVEEYNKNLVEGRNETIGKIGSCRKAIGDITDLLDDLTDQLDDIEYRLHDLKDELISGFEK